jgi:tetratricopeptide (TPR) repeat protein
LRWKRRGQRRKITSTMPPVPLHPPIIALALVAVFALPACRSEILEKQAEQIKQQEIEIARQRQEINDLLAGQQARDQKQRDCNRAFSDYFEKAQSSSDRERAIALYRDGLALCPDDEVARYELGKALADRGRYKEAELEFEAALRINPEFVDAKKQLEAVRKK